MVSWDETVSGWNAAENDAIAIERLLWRTRNLRVIGIRSFTMDCT